MRKISLGIPLAAACLLTGVLGKHRGISSMMSRDSADHACGDNLTGGELASGYIDNFIVETLKGKTSNWDEPLFGNTQASECAKSSCGFPSLEECDGPDSNGTALFWARFVVASYANYVDNLRSIFRVIPHRDYHVSSIDKDFLSDATESIVVNDVVNAMAMAMSRASFAAGQRYNGSMGQSMAAALGSIFSVIEFKLNVPSNASASIASGVGHVTSAAVQSLSAARGDLFGDGDISSWVPGLISGKYQTNIANFFDERFFAVMRGSEVKALGSNLNLYFSQGLVGVALKAANYHILRESLAPEECADITSGTGINGTCFRLAKGQNSDNMSPEALQSLTDKYHVNLTDVYRSSVACPIGTASKDVIDDVFVSLSALPACFYNLTVCDAADKECVRVSSGTLNMGTSTFLLLILALGLAVNLL